MRAITSGRLLVWGLTSLALAMGIFRFWNNPGMEGDSLQYLIPIHNLIQGKGYTLGGMPELMFPPGLGILAYPFFLVTGDIEYSGMLASLFCYVLIIPTTYHIALKLFDRRCAAVSAFFVVTTPKLLQMSVSCMSDVPFCFFLLLGLWLYIGNMEMGGRLRSVLLGACLGFVYLLRPEGILVAALALLSLVFVNGILVSGTDENRLRRLFSPCLAIATFVVCASPYMIFLHEHTGRWAFSEKGAHNLVAGEKGLRGPDHKVEFPGPSSGAFSFLDYVHSQGWGFGLRIVRNTVGELFYLWRITCHAIVPLALLWLMYPFVATGRLFSDQTESGSSFQIALSLTIFVSPLMIYPFFFLAERFLLPYALIMMIVLAFLTTSFWSRMNQSFGRTWLSHGFMALVMVAIVHHAAMGLFRTVPRFHHVDRLPISLYSGLKERTGPWGLRAAGMWIKEHMKNGNEVTIVAPMMGNVALFYAEGKKEPSGKSADVPSGATVEEVVTVLKNGPHRILVLEDLHGKLKPYWPDLASLWTNPTVAARNGLRKVFEDPEGLFMIVELAGVDKGSTLSPSVH